MAFKSIAKSILHDAELLDEYIRANNLPQPSFDVDGPPRTVYTGETATAHASLLANTHRLHLLAEGPAGRWLPSLAGATGDAVTTAAVQHFKIADHVPLDSQASFEDVAEKCGLALRDFKIIVRYAMTNFIFCEPQPGFIAHTAASKLLAENRLIRASAAMRTDDIFLPGFKEIEALEKFPGSQEPTESAWGLAHNASLPMFEELEARHPERAKTFASAIEAISAAIADTAQLGVYDWASLGSGTLVDVGGGKGYACRPLAKHFPELSFIVQDLEGTAATGREQLPPDLHDRVTFMTHDFFTPQPVKGADAYYFRAIFHNWPDKYCVRILQNLIPSLKKGARVLIHDPHTPDPLTSHPWAERQTR
ncbi:hypothetical protein H2200_008765 [Cladophialophora chaetospira]|uniref:O-methyltransferase C-terminal domain-containing protein n=1 Tax=Cladophialophora chaetospira TaxID=386627 RepID=A0AA38X4P8_9EURO|nr:hypothetical protein H2200_008765 [Cladophialophora chaetospira]